MRWDYPDCINTPAPASGRGIFSPRLFARFPGRKIRRDGKPPQKKETRRGAGFQKGRVTNASGWCLNIRCLFAFRALHDLEGDLLAFLQRLEAIHLDGREVCKQILATLVRRDESETLCVVKPFDRTSCHSNFPCNSCHHHEPSKSHDRTRQSIPPHKLTIGIFSKLWLSEKSASLIVGALYSSVKKILRRRCRVANRSLSRVFPASVCAVAQAAWLEKSHNRLTCWLCPRRRRPARRAFPASPGRLCDTRSDRGAALTAHGRMGGRHRNRPVENAHPRPIMTAS
jgi:hypothetical protein